MLYITNISLLSWSRFQPGLHCSMLRLPSSVLLVRHSHVTQCWILCMHRDMPLSQYFHFFTTLSFCVTMNASPWLSPRIVCTKHYNIFWFRLGVATENVLYPTTYISSATYHDIGLYLSAPEGVVFHITFFSPPDSFIPIRCQANFELQGQYTVGLSMTNLANCSRTKAFLLLHAFLPLYYFNLLID